MSGFAGSHTPTLTISRLISRDRRTRVGFHGVGSRIVAALVSAAILFAAYASVRAERDPSALYSAATAASLPALHSAVLRRVPLDARSSTRRSTKAPLDTALPARAAVSMPVAADQAASGRALESFAATVAVRGYDATAPPALS